MEWTRFKPARQWQRSLLVAAMAAMLAGLLGACGKQAAAPEARLLEGHKFPPLTLGSTSGDVLSTTSYDGKMLVLNVWATWCPPCRREMPSLERLSRALDPKRFAVIGLSTDEDEILATEFLLQNHITFANFFDKDGKFAKQLGMKVYPETFLIAPDGTLLQRLPGLHEWDGHAMIAHLEDAYRRHRHGEMNDMKGSRQVK